MKTLFVTGAASGIGKTVCRFFGERGFFVGCYDIDVEGAKSAAEAVGPQSCHGRLDVTSAESWQTAYADFAATTSGRLDVLFNSAGILRMGRFEELSAEDDQKQLDVNVMGTVHGIKTCLPALERSRGRIVNMSSASAVYGQPELAVYSASKFAVRALTEALDIEFRARGVTICDVMPGYVDTPMVRSQTYRAKTLDKLGVKLTADDVARVVWMAANGSGVHYMPQADLQMLSRLGGLVPELGRIVMRRIATA
jgi:NAD(P)-dependent dehydrogenase (short-subunit alcohol dehydrogenase family)